MSAIKARPGNGGEGNRSERRGEHHLRVVVVGAGFSGISVASRLRERGEEDFAVLERGESVGGVWRDNTYPGVACDVPSHLYSLSFAPNPEWDRAFSPGRHIKEYLESVVSNRGLEPWISLREELLDAAWDADTQTWRIVTTRRSLSANVLVSCAGPLTEPVFPDVPSLECFRGKTFHTSRWDNEHDLSGERVAVVGTGASAVQVVPEIQPRVGYLAVFQRTPGWVVPRPDREISEREKRVLRAFPQLVRLYRLGQFAVRDLLNYRMIRRNRFLRRLLEKTSRRLLEQHVDDPELRAKLTPDYEIGCKRVLITDDFYPALVKPNVELVASAVREVREGSLVAEDGTEREIDTIIFATGFETSESPILSRIRGRGGRSIDEVWNGRPRFHRATAIAGFPNFFNLCSAGTGSGHGSMVWKAESQTAYVMDALRVMRERNLSSVEVRPGAQDSYMRWVGEDLDRTVWARGGCRSWYLDDSGRPSLMWPRTMRRFRCMLRRFDAEHYLLRPAREAGQGVERGEAVRDGGPAPILQVLLYPATDMAKRTRSHKLFGSGFLLTRELRNWFAAHYVAGVDPADPRLSVLRAEALGGVALAFVVTAGFDPLRDEGEAYAEVLRAAGVAPVTLRRFPGLVHGFCNAIGASTASRAALIEVAGATRALLATVSRRGASRES